MRAMLLPYLRLGSCLRLGLSLAFGLSFAVAQTDITWDNGPTPEFADSWTSCSNDALPSAGLCLAGDDGAITLLEGGNLQDYYVQSEIVIDDAAAGVALVARASEDTNNLYQLELIEFEGQKVWQFVKREGGDWSLLERGAFEYETDVPYLLRFSVVGNSLSGEISRDVEAAEPTWTLLGNIQDDSFAAGRAGLKLITDNVAFGDVAVAEMSEPVVASTPEDDSESGEGLLDLSTFDTAELNTQTLDAAAARVSAAQGNQDLLDTDLFVSPDGSNDNAGTQESPFASVQRCADAVQPGQRCVLRSGTYRETVTPPSSGSAEAPIIFTNYPGERPVISGADLVSDFAAEGDQQKATVDWDLGIGNNQLFINGEMQPEARWPNLGGDISRPQKVNIVSAQENNRQTYVVELESAPPVDVTGAKANLGLSNLPNGHVWLYDSATVDAADGNRITVSSVDGADLYRPVDPDNDLFIWGKRELIDDEGEWYLDANSQSLYLAHGDVQNAQIELKRRELAFDLSARQHIQVEGLDIFAATILSDKESSDLLFSDLNVLYPSHFTLIEGIVWTAGPSTGVVLYGARNTLQNSTVAYSAGNGVSLDGESHRLENNVIHDVNYVAVDAAAVSTRCNPCANYSYGHVIRNNTMFNAGRSIIVHRETGGLVIEYNHLYNGGLQTDDNGMTYTFQTDGDGTVIAYNVIHANLAEHDPIGIYLDNDSSNFSVHNNIVYGVGQALKLNLPSYNNQIYNNTLLGSSYSVTSWGPEHRPRELTGSVLRNNIIPNGLQFITEAGLTRSDNLESDPGFVNVEGGDFSLREGSPATDAGVTIEGLSFEGAAPDMGAIEFGEPSWAYGASRTD